MKDLTIEILKIGDITPYENNPRNNDEAVDYVAKSIKEFGFKVPIIVDKNNVIIAGHTRYKASKKLGLKKVPVIRADDLSEDQVKAFRLADNKVGEIATWDLDKLNVELGDIEIDMSEFGFDPIEQEDIEVKDDDFVFDDERKPAISKPGQIYKLGDHTLMCGDSTKAEDVQKLMDGHIADLVVTDPPYNVDYEGKTEEALTIENDDMSDEDFYNFLFSAFANLSEHLKEGGSFYIWYASRNVIQFVMALKDNGLEVRQELIWNKNVLTFGRQDYQWKHEPCLYGWKEGASHYFIDDRTQTTVLNFDRPSQSRLHPTMKPLELIGYQIMNSSKAGDVVLDLFGGSGSTLIACEQTGRICYMMEKDPFYVDVIIKRYEEFTGKKAVLLEEAENV